MAQDSHSRKLHEGIMYKKGKINKSWKERYFVLYNSRRLAYFEKKTSVEPIKQIDLSDVQSINIIPHQNRKAKKNNTDDFESKLQRTESISVASQSDKEFSFQLTTPKRTYLLSCRNHNELNEWIDHLEKSIFGGRLYQGWLIKRGAYRKSWKKRYFVIYDTQEMRYYDDQSRLAPKGLIKLHEVLLMCPGDKDQYSEAYTIQLMTPDRNWVLAATSQKERDEWFGRLEETIHGAKRLITSHEGYLWKRGQVVKSWKKRYFALSKGWLFYFEEKFHCNKFKSIAFFSEAFFNQAFRLYVKGSIPLHQTTIQKVEVNTNELKKLKQHTKKNVFNDNEQSVNSVDAPDKQHVFKIVTEKREFQFATETENDLERWFKAFHSTHSNNTNNGDAALNEESEMTENRSDDDAEYDILAGLNSTNGANMDSGDENDDEVEALPLNINNNNDEEKNNDTTVKNRRNSKTPLMDIIDPKGNAKWVDIEQEEIEKQQSDIWSSSFKNDNAITPADTK